MLLRFDPLPEYHEPIEPIRGRRRVQSMPMDAYRRSDHVVLHFDVPGVDPDAIELTVEKNVLSITAERTWKEVEGDELFVCERSQGARSRQLYLSDNLDRERIEARCENGVLTITLPLLTPAKPSRIQVTSSPST